jgi:hypothetical protein
MAINLKTTRALGLSAAISPSRPHGLKAVLIYHMAAKPVRSPQARPGRAVVPLKARPGLEIKLTRLPRSPWRLD